MSAWQTIDAALAKLGLRFGAPTAGQTTAGGHVSGSEHYQGRARDYGDANSDVTGITQALLPYATGPNAPIDELFSSRDNVFMKNGAPITPDAALRQGHYNHVHVGVRQGVDLAAIIAGPGVGASPADPSSSVTATPVSTLSSVTSGFMRPLVEVAIAGGGLVLIVLGARRATIATKGAVS